MNTHTIVVDMRRDMLKSREDAGGQNLTVNDTHASASPNNAYRRSDPGRI